MMDSVNLLRFMAPAALLMLLPLTLIFEDVERIAGFFSPESNPKHLSFSLLLLLNSLCAFFVNLLNFLVRSGDARRRRPPARAAAGRSRAPPSDAATPPTQVTKKTNALTLQVLGNAKGVVATVVSVLIFRNPLTVQSILGYTVTLCGIAAYSREKNAPK